MVGMIRLLSVERKENTTGIVLQIDQDLRQFVAQYVPHEGMDSFIFEDALVFLLPTKAMKRLVVLLSGIHHSSGVDLPAEIWPGGIDIPQYLHKRD